MRGAAVDVSDTDNVGGELMPAFEVAESGGIAVRTPGRAIKVVPVPKGISDIAFRNALATVQVLFNETGSFPTIDDCAERWPNIPRATWAKIFATEQFEKALDYHGIAFEPGLGLSYEQNMVLLSLADHSDRRNQGVKLRELGVPVSRFQSWMRDATFAAARKRLAENNLKDAEALLVDKVITRADEGDMAAIKLGLEMTGRYNPNAASVADARAVVQSIIELLIYELKDQPDVLKRIVTGIESRAVGYSVPIQQIGA